MDSKPKPCEECGDSLPSLHAARRFCDQCRVVRRARSGKPWRERNPTYNSDHWAKNRHKYIGSARDRTLRSYYNISEADYMTMFAAQDERCAICGSKSERWLDVDHDHACCPGGKSCGKCVRGLLCHSCNVGLGGFRDQADRLQNAIKYLGG